MSQLACILTALSLALVMALTGCSAPPQPLVESPAQEQSAAPSAPADTEAVLAAMADEEKNWMHLTAEQYLNDFDYLLQAMVDNYPYFGVVERALGVRIEDLHAATRQQVALCASDYEYWQLVRDFVGELDYTGHISAWGTRYTYQLESLYEFVEEYPEYAAKFEPYIRALENPVSQQNYAAMERFFEEVESQVAAPADEQEDEHVDAGPPEEWHNVETEILEEGRIAYLSIAGMDMMTYAEDKVTLFDFYRRVAGYDHLIVDITQNGGGGMNYFSDLVVAPNIAEPLSVNVYLLVKGGDIIRSFLLNTGLDEWKPISELPALPGLNADDAAEMAYFSDEPYTVEPTQEAPLFDGRIWLLVSEHNYSSSEYAAMFSKHSGFATLVGHQTGGDGIGVDPVYIVLPHSGLVVQFSPVYGATHDGASSEEFGTLPDIESPAGETALQTCLNAIAGS